jgi:AcrR family transcriptional regulator
MAAATTVKTEMSSVARHIARVAARLFAQNGYDATSVREIVEAAGVAKPTLYYYFRSKEGLAQALLTVPLANLVGALRKAVSTVEDPVACLVHVMEAQYAFCREDPDRARFIYALLFGPLGAGVAGELEPFKADLVGWTEAAVRRLAEAEIVARERIGDCATACRGLIVVATLDFLYEEKPLRRDLAHRQVNDLLRGFARAESALGQEPLT